MENTEKMDSSSDEGVEDTYQEEQPQKFAELNEGDDEVKIENQEGKDVASYAIDYISDSTWQTLGVDKDLGENLISKGFKNPSKIQSNVFQVFKKTPVDIVAQSQNGSGKTLSFLVPSLNCCDPEVLNTKKVVCPQVVIIADTKELAYQICKIANLVKKEWQIVDLMHQEKNKFDDINVHVLVATLGSLFFMIRKKKMSLENLKFLVIDEADKMVISDANKNKLPSLFKAIKTARIGLFSATLPEKCVEILQTLGREFTKIVIKKKQDLSLKNLSHYWVKCSREEKLGFIDTFMKEMTKGSVIMFVNSRKFADRFARSLYKLGHKTEILVGDMRIQDRLEILDKFKQGKIRILISTNLISRGIDARKVSLVINLDMPYLYDPNAKRGERITREIDSETYLHRTGRTARFGDKGVALNIIENEHQKADIGKLEAEYGLKMIEITKDNFQAIVETHSQNVAFTSEKRKANKELI